MRSFYITCSVILLLLLASLCNGYAVDSKNSSSLLQERSNADIKKDCAEVTTTTTTTTSHTKTTATSTAPTKTHSNASSKDEKPCCHPKDKDAKCCKEDEKPLFEPQVIAAGVLLIIAGTYLLVYGFPMFRVTVAVIGFIFGGAVTWIGLQANEPTESYPNASDLYIGTCVAVAAVVAVLCVVLYKAGLYLLCGMAGVLLAIYIYCWHTDFFLQNIFYRTLFTLSLVVAFILGLIFLEFATVILSMAMVGAYMLALGIDLFVRTGLVKSLEVLLDFNQERNAASKYHLNKINIWKRSAPGEYNPDWRTHVTMGCMIAVKLERYIT
ncbi:hypothetical protein MUCCIDRAFT_80391 [Mucor lusitanicus CBS 277.49]|uniref:Transmembrane protein 198 n=2 Tax=Mucor circinelloides f. lusitanicus TaxID=29924 RepID=A0A162QSD7_MUCCL|nr:hypothetical protein MUCCIDRAFT_80391 [Mucor lusitanicus CBS 277.49]